MSGPARRRPDPVAPTPRPGRALARPGAYGAGAAAGPAVPPVLWLVLDWVVRLRWLLALPGALVGVRSVAGHPDLPRDFVRWFDPAGRHLLHGDLGAVFASKSVQAGPFELVWQAGWVQLARAVGVPAVPALAAVSGAALVLALFAVTGALVREMCGELGVGTRLGVPGAGAVTRSGLAQLVAGVLVLVLPLAGDSVSSGHPAEVVIPLTWLLVALWSRQGRMVAAAALLAAGAGWEVWALLGVPLLALAPVRTWPRRVPLAAAAGGGVLAGLFGPFAATGHFAMFHMVWATRVDSLEGMLFPSMLVVTWPVRLAQAVAVLAAGTAVVVLARRSVHVVWLAPLTVAAARLVSDPLLFGYYWQQMKYPALVAAAAALALGVGRRVAVGALVWSFLTPPLPEVWQAGALLVALLVLARSPFTRPAQASAAGSAGTDPTGELGGPGERAGQGTTGGPVADGGRGPGPR